MHDWFPFLDRTLHATTASTVGIVLQRLAVAAALGGAIGIERQIKHRPAGLRTIMFMCFGSALFTIVSGLMAGGGSEDTRIAAQIVTGIGFIGAGVILHSGASVQGVTTAATIFVVAAIGMCAGAGLMFPATVAAALAIFGLFILGSVEQHAFPQVQTVAYLAVAANLGDVFRLIEDARSDKRSKLLDVRFTNQHGAVQVEFTLEARKETQQALQAKLCADLEVHKIISFSTSEQE